MFCYNCRAEISADDVKCSQCGVELKKSFDSSKEDKDTLEKNSVLSGRIDKLILLSNIGFLSMFFLPLINLMSTNLRWVLDFIPESVSLTDLSLYNFMKLFHESLVSARDFGAEIEIKYYLLYLILIIPIFALLGIYRTIKDDESQYWLTCLNGSIALFVCIPLYTATSTSGWDIIGIAFHVWLLSAMLGFFSVGRKTCTWGDNVFIFLISVFVPYSCFIAFRLPMGMFSQEFAWRFFIFADILVLIPCILCSVNGYSNFTPLFFAPFIIILSRIFGLKGHTFLMLLFIGAVYFIISLVLMLLIRNREKSGLKILSFVFLAVAPLIGQHAIVTLSQSYYYMLSLDSNSKLYLILGVVILCPVMYLATRKDSKKSAIVSD